MHFYLCPNSSPSIVCLYSSSFFLFTQNTAGDARRALHRLLSSPRIFLSPSRSLTHFRVTKRRCPPLTSLSPLSWYPLTKVTAMSSTSGDEIKPRTCPTELRPWPPEEKRNWAQRVVINLLDRPVKWFRESIVLPGRAGNVYYHRKFQRVPTIDECYTDDILCAYEANMQWKRDRKVDAWIVEILKSRLEKCMGYYEKEKNEIEKCAELAEDYNTAMTNHFKKNGDLGATGTARDAYFKQVHRLIMERREAIAKEVRDKSAGEV